VVEARAGVQARVGRALVELREACAVRNVLVAVRAGASVRINALRARTAVQAR
jgi:hypothetical protein